MFAGVLPGRGLLAMRICPNPKCAVFGRIVYIFATRCPLCRWDLKPVLPASEAVAAHPEKPPEVLQSKPNERSHRVARG